MLGGSVKCYPFLGTLTFYVVSLISVSFLINLVSLSISVTLYYLGIRTLFHYSYYSQNNS